MGFMEDLEEAWSIRDTLLCVGLDPDIARLPEHLTAARHPFFEFNRAIVDATADLVCAFKPQIAHYSAQGAEDQLERTIDYIHQTYPGTPVILDAKRNDIGSTAEMYAREAFDRYGADAVTVNPYLGYDSLQPFLNRKERGIAILCRTSNPGAVDIQDLEVAGKRLYRIVAQKAKTEWNQNDNVLLVVGATYPRELGEIRSIVGDMPLLVPGVGAQGGDVEAAVTMGKNSRGTGMIINASRAIIYAGGGGDFARAARKAARSLRDQINRTR